MSEENVQVVRGFFEAWNAGDMDALREIQDPDVILRTVENWPEPGPYIGRAAVMRWFEQLRDTWDADEGEPINFIDASDRVVVRFIWHGAGHHGPESNMEFTCVFTVRNGRVSGQDYFWDHAEALEAAGLSEYAMSQENVEIVRRIYEAAIRRDAASVLALYDPEVELDASRIGVSNRPSGADTYHGHDGLRDLFREWHEAWGKIEYDYEELIDAGEQVIAVVNRHARGRASGVEVERPFALLWTVREGKVVRVVWFLTREEALEAAGLRE